MSNFCSQLFTLSSVEMFSPLAVFCGNGTVVPCGHSLSARLFSRKLPRQGFPGSAIIVASDRQYDRCQRRTEFDVGSDRASFEVKKLETYGHPFFRCAVRDAC